MSVNIFKYLPYISWAICGLIFVFSLFMFLYKPKTKIEKHIETKTILHNNLTLKDKIDIINGKNSFGSNAVKNYFFDIKLTLAKMNKIDAWPKVKLLSVVCTVGAFIACMAMNNMFLSIILIPVCAILPFALVKVKYRRHNTLLEKELETALSLVTISYTRTANFIVSVQECIDTLPPNVKPFFEDFLIEVTSINANVTSALINLKTKIENRTFQQWIDRVIICQSDRTAIPSLQNYVNEFAENRAIQEDLDAEVFSMKIEMYAMMGFVFFTPLLLKFVQKEALDQLLHSTVGKITITIAAFLVLVVFIIGNKVAKPVKFRGNRD